MLRAVTPLFTERDVDGGERYDDSPPLALLLAANGWVDGLRASGAFVARLTAGLLDGLTVFLSSIDASEEDADGNASVLNASCTIVFYHCCCVANEVIPTIQSVYSPDQRGERDPYLCSVVCTLASKSVILS